MPRVLDDPTFLPAFLCAGPVVLWVMTLVSWMIQDELNPLEGALAIGMIVGLCFMGIASRIEWVAYGLLVGMIGGGVMLPLIRRRLHESAHAKIDVETIAQCYRSLDSNYRNIGAKVQLSRMCYRRKLYGPAMALMAEVISEAGEAIDSEKWTLSIWEKDHGRDLANHRIRCPKCLSWNAPSIRYCGHCGAAVLLLMSQGQLGRWVVLRGALWLWVIALAFLALSPYIVVTFSPMVAGAVIVLGLLLSGFLFVRILRPHAV